MSLTKAAIITLDIINEICHADGQLSRYVDRIIDNHIITHINNTTQWGRQHNMLIFNVRLGFMPHYRDASAVSPLFSAAAKNQILQRDSWGCQFCDDFERAATDIDIIKHRVSAFYGTDLDLILRANKIETLIITGVATNMAVELTAREAHDRDYQVIVVSDAVECASDAEQAATLAFIPRIGSVLTHTQLMHHVL